MDIKQFAEEVYAANQDWWESGRTLEEIIDLCHSDLSKALEEYRSGKGYTEIYKCCYKCKHNPRAGYNCDIGDMCNKWEQRHKPEGVPIALASCIIRIMEFFEHYGLDSGLALDFKHEYNLTRPYRHGGKVI